MWLVANASRKKRGRLCLLSKRGWPIAWGPLQCKDMYMFIIAFSFWDIPKMWGFLSPMGCMVKPNLSICISLFFSSSFFILIDMVAYLLLIAYWLPTRCLPTNCNMLIIYLDKRSIYLGLLPIDLALPLWAHLPTYLTITP